ncbi:MAG: RNA pseudouridine synthase [Pirellulaceae bacterium]|nr:RNA pseudouridine synthase [Pirellulaceae bacterium]MDG2102513.1 RNA pseudouridine synthase [Pirellulaceae bacterium]
MHNQQSESLPNPEIIQETDRFLAVIKPGGLLTQAPSGIDSMEVRVKQYLAAQTGNRGKVYLGIPHRLDRPASGVMVFAKDKKTARFFAEQFQQRLVGKQYLAIVQGQPTSDRGSWTDNMRKIPGEARSEICPPTQTGAQEAVLHFEQQPLDAQASQLLIQLETGRSHQIRLQSSSRGFPIWGDELYGSQIPYGPQTDDLRSRWIALHAWKLEICSPDTKQPVQFTAQVPTYWPPTEDPKA